MTLAKGLTSGYLPLGAVAAGARVAEPFFRDGATEIFRHGYTYSGHPTSCAVAMANLDLIEREQLVERVRSLEAVLQRALKPLADHPMVSEVRTGAGLLAAVEVAEDVRRERPDLLPSIVRAARDQGVLTRALRGQALQVSPPFVVSEAEIERMATVFAQSLDASA
jgi:adenosylmethionine-8-amino-7-oxononanoate aminotransferase